MKDGNLGQVPRTTRATAAAGVLETLTRIEQTPDCRAAFSAIPYKFSDKVPPQLEISSTSRYGIFRTSVPKAFRKASLAAQLSAILPTDVELLAELLARSPGRKYLSRKRTGCCPKRASIRSTSTKSVPTPRVLNRLPFAQLPLAGSARESSSRSSNPDSGHTPNPVASTP